MIKLLKCVFFAAFAACGTVAFAADLPPEVLNEVMQSCRVDYHRLCGDVLPGDGRVGRCLRDNEDRLSPSCLKATKFAYAIEVCLPDYRRYCGNVQPGAGRIVECLANRSGSLRPECQRIVSINTPYFIPEDRRYGDYRERTPDGESYRGERPYGDRYAEPPYGSYRDADRNRYAYRTQPSYPNDRYTDQPQPSYPNDRYDYRGDGSRGSYGQGGQGDYGQQGGQGDDDAYDDEDEREPVN